MRKILFSTILLVPVCLFMGVYAYYHLPYDRQATAVHIRIAKGESLFHTADNLAEKGLVRFPSLFVSISRFLGKDRTIRSGEYRLHSSMSPMEILRKFCLGHVIFHKVTIPEGTTVKQVAAILDKKGLAETSDILKTNRDPDFLKEMKIDQAYLEGYLFPDTYFFAKGLLAEDILKIMIQRFREVYSPEMKAKQADLGWSLHKIITMASIIEKETSSGEERKLIASVLFNRLRKGIRLQCDPTVIYGIKDFDGNIKRKHLRSNDPYNTYVHKGLPPGPICNPGLDSLKAVLEPDSTSYLYFVSKNNGTHHFSSSLKEHNKAVVKYQKQGRRRSSSSLEAGKK